MDVGVAGDPVDRPDGQRDEVETGEPQPAAEPVLELVMVDRVGHVRAHVVLVPEQCAIKGRRREVGEGEGVQMLAGCDASRRLSGLEGLGLKCRDLTALVVAVDDAVERCQ